MMKLLKNANIYTPSPIGKKDILIEGEKILRIADHIDGYENLPDVEIYDLNGKTVVPATSICMSTSPAVVESRDRHHGCRNLR